MRKKTKIKPNEPMSLSIGPRFEDAGRAVTEIAYVDILALIQAQYFDGLKAQHDDEIVLKIEEILKRTQSIVENQKLELEKTLQKAIQKKLPSKEIGVNFQKEFKIINSYYSLLQNLSISSSEGTITQIAVNEKLEYYENFYKLHSENPEFLFASKARANIERILFIERNERLQRIKSHAERVFGSKEKSKRWLHKPCRALNNAVPIELAANQSGAWLVEEELHAIDHGMFA